MRVDKKGLASYDECNKESRKVRIDNRSNSIRHNIKLVPKLNICRKGNFKNRKIGEILHDSNAIE